MSALIDRLIELAEWADANEWEVPIDLGDTIMEAVERLKRMQWAAMEKDADAPPSGTEVLVALRTGEIHRASYRRGHWYDYETRAYAEDRATHWMSMPEPPEANVDGK